MMLGIFCCWFLYLLHRNGGASKVLYFVPNNAGLFSLFLQAKAMAEYCESVDRKLVMVPTKSIHYGNRAITLCDSFKFSENISCGMVPKGENCINTLRRRANKHILCYNGLINILGLSGPTKARYPTGREVTFRAVNIDIPLEFASKNLDAMNAFMKAIGGNMNQNWTVAHWRRGDQILRRCKTLLDKSVNCANGNAFATKVRRHTNDSLIYVATNERNITELNMLHSAGMITFQRLLYNTSFNFSNLTKVDVLLSEVYVMLRATTFLAWGISEMDDVVQYERKKRGRSFCVAQDNISSVYELNWCAHEMKIFPLNWKKVIFPAATPHLQRQQQLSKRNDK